MTFDSGEIDPSQSLGGGAPLRTAPAPVSEVTFSRRELNRILDLYGRKVAAGEGRDYAIEKNPKLARRQGAYSVISATGLIVRRGHELDRVLRSIDRLALVPN